MNTLINSNYWKFLILLLPLVLMFVHHFKFFVADDKCDELTVDETRIEFAKLAISFLVVIFTLIVGFFYLIVVHTGEIKGAVEHNISVLLEENKEKFQAVQLSTEELQYEILLQPQYFNVDSFWWHMSLNRSFYERVISLKVYELYDKDDLLYRELIH